MTWISKLERHLEQYDFFACFAGTADGPPCILVIDYKHRFILFANRGVPYSSMPPKGFIDLKHVSVPHKSDDDAVHVQYHNHPPDVLYVKRDSVRLRDTLQFLIDNAAFFTDGTESLSRPPISREYDVHAVGVVEKKGKVRWATRVLALCTHQWICFKPDIRRCIGRPGTFETKDADSKGLNMDEPMRETPETSSKGIKAAIHPVNVIEISEITRASPFSSNAFKVETPQRTLLFRSTHTARWLGCLSQMKSCTAKVQCVHGHVSISNPTGFTHVKIGDSGRTEHEIARDLAHASFPSQSSDESLKSLCHADIGQTLSFVLLHTLFAREIFVDLKTHFTDLSAMKSWETTKEITFDHSQSSMVRVEDKDDVTGWKKGKVVHVKERRRMVHTPIISVAKRAEESPDTPTRRCRGYHVNLSSPPPPHTSLT